MYCRVILSLRKMIFNKRSNYALFPPLVVEVAGTRVGDGQVGQVAQAARQMIKRDQTVNGLLL